MKRLLPLLLVLAGCESEPEAVVPQPAAVDPTTGLPTAQPTAADTAKIQERIAQSLAPMLLDPGSARYANLRASETGAVCGDVDSKQPDGKHSGPRPFVITPDGIALVSPAASVQIADPSDVFADFYIRWCASPQELQRLAPEIRARGEAESNSLLETSETAELLPPEPIPGPSDAPAPTAAPPPPAEASRWGQSSPPNTPPAATKSGGEGSFADAVLRRRDENKSGN